MDKPNDGIILIDSRGQKFICGNPNYEKPLTLKILNKKLNWKPKTSLEDMINIMCEHDYKLLSNEEVN